MPSKSHQRGFGALSALFGFALALTLGAEAATASDFRFAPKAYGKDTVAGRCVVCHSIEKGGPPRYAPNLYGVIGDKKARKLGYFSYSSGLRRMGGTWTKEDLDKYLSNPQGFIPGTHKSVAVADADERAKIIDFLIAQSK